MNDVWLGQTDDPAKTGKTSLIISASWRETNVT
jgi:hypothetical protein